MNEIILKVSTAFKEKFSEKSRMFFSPGRINFIGEHVDYNDGFVMPAAIDKGVYYAIAPNNSDTLNFYALDFEEELSIKIADIKKLNSWKNYVLSVVNEFVLLNKKVEGFNCVFGGNIANGAGISSSAAVEGGLAFGLNEIFNFGLNRKELALLCQRAEHNFPGVNCGIMDQYANMFGKEDQVILLDCRSIEHQYFPLKISGYDVVLINTKVHHSLATSQYNVRRKQCEEGLSILKKHLHISSFRDVKNVEEIFPFKEEMGDDIFKRCTFVVGEILRTQKAAKLLGENKIEDFGKLMFETHNGLSKLYEVSCKELDFLADEAKNYPAVIGARMMGGGFGGCTINIVKTQERERFLSEITAKYKEKFSIDAETHVVKTGDGTREIEC